MTGLEWNANLPPPLLVSCPCWGMLTLLRCALTGFACWAWIGQLTRGAITRGVFILNLIFIDESYQLSRPVWSRLRGMSAIFHSCFDISLNDSSAQFVSLSGSTLFLSKHTCLLISSDHFIQPAPSFTFSGAFFIISAFCHRYLRGKLRVRIGAGLSRTRNLLWKPGSNRRNPGNVLPTKWVPFPWKSSAELGM